MTLKYGEIFGGIGAWRKALNNLGVESESVFTIEFDERIIDGYNAIHGTNYSPIDITTLDETTLPDCDIIFYSPPCQAFSVAGKELGFGDERGVLFFDALRVIKHKQPKYAIMENVKGLTQKKFENEFRIMLDKLEEAGYKNHWKVVNAKDQNFPQNRERVFILSIRNDIEQEYEFPNDKALTHQLKEYLESDASNTILHNIYGGFKEANARVFSGYSPTIRTSAGGGHIPSVLLNQEAKLTIINGTYNYDNKKGFKAVQKVEDKLFVEKGDFDEVLDSNKDQLVGDDWFIIRQMTTSEAFKLMGFEVEDYEKARDVLNNKYHKGKDKSDTQLYKMAGNSIVVNVIEELISKLLK